MTTKRRNQLISFCHNSQRQTSAIKRHQLQVRLMEEEKQTSVLNLVLQQAGETHLVSQTV